MLLVLLFYVFLRLDFTIEIRLHSVRMTWFFIEFIVMWCHWNDSIEFEHSLWIQRAKMSRATFSLPKIPRSNSFFCLLFFVYLSYKISVLISSFIRLFVCFWDFFCGAKYYHFAGFSLFARGRFVAASFFRVISTFALWNFSVAYFACHENTAVDTMCNCKLNSFPRFFFRRYFTLLQMLAKFDVCRCRVLMAKLGPDTWIPHS